MSLKIALSLVAVLAVLVANLFFTGVVALYFAPRNVSAEPARHDFVMLYSQYDQGQGEFSIWENTKTGACFVRFYDNRGAGLAAVPVAMCTVYEAR